MRTQVKVLLGAGTLSAVASTKSPASGVSRVIQLLTSLKQKVETETAAGAKEAEAYADACIKSVTELEADVKYGGEKADEFAAMQESESAKADGFSVEVATLGPQIAKLQEEKKTAGIVRADESKTFQGEENELVEASTMLTQAYSVLKRSLSGSTAFLQQAPEGDRVKKVVQALSAVVSASWIDAKSTDKIKSFLEADDSLTLKQPQAIVSAYESKSGGILDAIEDLQEKTAESLSHLRSKEMDAKHAYELLAQDLTNQISTKEDLLAAAKQNQADAAEAAGKAGADFAATSDALASDKQSLADTKADCHKAADAWTARKASADDEMDTLAKAIEILSGKFSLLQTSAHVVRKGSDEFEIREKASAILRRLGHKFNNFGLLQAASSAQADTFGKVRTLIKDMIMKLEESAAAEASKEAKCKSDIESGTRDVKVKGMQMKKVQTRLDASSAKSSQLTVEIDELNTEIKDLGVAMRAATAMRTEEKKSNAAVVKDAEEAIEAINGAVSTLTEFYGGASSLLQTNQPQTDAAGPIIAILQQAQTDYEKIRQETEAAEEAAEADYEKDMQDGKVSLAKKKALVEGKTAEKATLKVMIAQLDDDLGNAQKAYEASVGFLKNKKEECANKAMSYEERKMRREDEIKGLQEALEILSAEE
ncbi:unnamed protein product [Amoebophrya sp. A25]|nr:unnamed protein product [Amoebophrya sp. A25]|eukprot:GSA25T00021900001.1